MDELDDCRQPLLSDDQEIDPDAAFGGKLARKELETRLLSKLDTRMSILVLIYILNYIDRNNASAARLHGFERDLNLTGSQFASTLSILYVGYLLMQIPSNMFLNYVGRPSIFLPSCMIVWGVLSFATGCFKGVMYTRFFIGAEFWSLSSFLISKWYKRKELSQRTALLSCGSLISNAFGSLIASGILDGMTDVWGYASWRWLFFLGEPPAGGMTVFVALLALFILPDFPATPSNWLSLAEQALAQRRMAEDGEDLGQKQGSTSGLFMAISDWQVWWLAITLASIVLSLSFNAYFPTLAETMGYGKTLTLLLWQVDAYGLSSRVLTLSSAPPWFFATLVSFGISRHLFSSDPRLSFDALRRHSDLKQERFWHIVIPLLVGMLGFLLAMSTMNVLARYISLFLMAQSYAGFITYLSWASGNIRPSNKRAVALAMINMISSIGNIGMSVLYIWPSAWGPSYRASYSLCIFASALGILLSLVFRQHLAFLNAEAEKREAELDEQRGFRYLL
ncbi:MFS general substrate transporter [Mycena belliarum]|uniref:MFS general substrate transporter n=1 Tax=Mycena belliarum TaxID=1033014 RepID=A0AAD6U8X5_9AGAR|nr:MFS general substrate transporter [Mycena belliae]